MRRITDIAFCTAVLVAVCACSEPGPSGPGDIAADSAVAGPVGLVVSDTHRSASASVGAAGLSGAVDNASLAYVSAAPGTLPGAQAGSVQNQSSGGPRETFLINEGGFDPVGVVASPDDILVITLVGGPTSTIIVKVPKRRPPEVVRTRPARGRADVALSEVILVVFSEPIDPASMGASGVALVDTRDGQPVTGTVRVSSDGLSAEFLPAARLDPATTYSVVVDAAIRDFDGENITETGAVTFTTIGNGSVVVTVTTKWIGIQPLAGEYSLTLSNGMTRSIGQNAAITIPALEPGNYSIAIAGIPAQCAVVSGSARLVGVLPNHATAVEFTITCMDIPAGRIVFVSDRDGNPEIYAANIDGSDLKRLTNNAVMDDDPTWSPDGKRILFSRYTHIEFTNSADIFVMDADGTNERRLTTTGAGFTPAWSPDGASIVFSGLHGGWPAILVMRLDDPTKVVNVGHPMGYHTDPAWSPDGRRIVFTSDWNAYDFVYDLYAVNPDGSNMQSLITGPFFWPNLKFYFQASFSPDGAKLAVVQCGYAWDNCYPSSAIAISNADGSELTTLVQTSGFASPTWSPDGKAIAYSSQTCRGCVGEIRYVDVQTGIGRTIIANARNPSWQPR